MLRVLVLQDQPSRDGFHHEALLSSLLLPGGCEVQRAWAVTATDDWSNVQPSLRPWLVPARRVLDFSPDVLLIEGDPGHRQLPEMLVAWLQESKAVSLYLRASPFDSTKIDGFQHARFPLAHSGSGDIAYLATSPNDSVVRLENVSFPGGLWTDASGALSFNRLETRGLAYILCPEGGGFLPLLTAPLSYEAKDPVWRYGNTFGMARKPYCFAGIRWEPTWSMLFACDMFSDSSLDLAENRRFVGAMFTDILRHRAAQEQRPDLHPSMVTRWFAALR